MKPKQTKISVKSPHFEIIETKLSSSSLSLFWVGHILNKLVVQSLSGLKSIPTNYSPIISENINCFVYNLKVLQDNAKAWREVELHWKASGCPYIVGIKDVYQNKYGGSTCLLVVMEWFVELSSHIFFLSYSAFSVLFTRW